MIKSGRFAIAALVILACVLWPLLGRGLYGLTLFMALPMLVGALAGWVTAPESSGKASGAGAPAVMLSLALFLVLGAEGLICIAMAAPLAVPLGALGGWLAYRVQHSRLPSNSAAMLLLLPGLTVPFDFHATPPVYSVHSQIEIAATPEQVWRNVISFSELPEPHEWYFRAGLAYPERARIAGTGAGAVRHCEFSTGPFVEPIQVWDEPRLLHFTVTHNPAPMNELSPYGPIQPKHLHGYLVSKQGEFRLTALPGGRTLLEGTTWYQHGLWPAEYWRLWSDAIIHRIHMRVLTHIRDLSERGR